MLFEWDERKRVANIEKHGFDFIHADEVLTREHVLVPSSHHGDEERWLAVGPIEGRLATVIFTVRGDRHRIISIRRAARAERRLYEELHRG